MLEEIAQQPEALSRTIDEERAKVERLGRDLRARDEHNQVEVVGAQAPPQSRDLAALLRDGARQGFRLLRDLFEHQ